MQNIARLGTSVIVIATAIVALGDETSDEAYRARQLARMSAIADQFHVKSGETSAKLATRPILRYTDATRRQDEATLWLWTDRGLPTALLAVEFYPTSPKGPRWLFELVSLADAKIAVRRADEWNWQARKPGVVRVPVPDSPEPSDKVANRLVQIRQIRSRFTAHESGVIEGRVELRPLASPLHRYQDESSGVIDGAIFAFANGTNPEVLLLLEARRVPASNASVWNYGFAQMSGAVVHGNLDEKEVWTQGEADPPANRDTYVNGWLAGDETTSESR